MVLAEECWSKSLVPLMAEVRKQMGDKPVYISFDIDGLDPAYAPGTGTPEIAGLTPAQVRGDAAVFPSRKGMFLLPLKEAVLPAQRREGLGRSGSVSSWQRGKEMSN